MNIQSIINEKGKNVTKLTFFKFLYKPTYACMVELAGFCGLVSFYKAWKWQCFMFFFLLVLVMWAVHSHGSAYETESIIYNNTQLPYKENMNAETVINSKLKHFDYFYLVMQWPKSFCTSGRVSCHPPPIPNYFIVHGLWPQQTSRKNTTPYNFTKV